MKLHLLLLVVFLFSLVGCGGGGGTASSVTGGTAPVISNLQYSPTSATMGSGGGAVTINGTIDFIDTDGDLLTITIDPNDGNAATSNLIAVSGVVAGTLQVVTGSDTTTKGVSTADIWVTDSQGNASNKLKATFTVF